MDAPPERGDDGEPFDRASHSSPDFRLTSRPLALTFGSTGWVGSDNHPSGRTGSASMDLEVGLSLAGDQMRSGTDSVLTTRAILSSFTLPGTVPDPFLRAFGIRPYLSAS